MATQASTPHVILSEAKNLLANRSPLPFDAAYLLRNALSLAPRRAVTLQGDKVTKTPYSYLRSPGLRSGAKKNAAKEKGAALFLDT